MTSRMMLWVAQKEDKHTTIWTGTMYYTTYVYIDMYAVNSFQHSRLEMSTQIRTCTYMGVSKNRGTPKWMVYNGKPCWMDDLEVPPFKETSIYTHAHITCVRLQLLLHLSKKNTPEDDFTLEVQHGLWNPHIYIYIHSICIINICKYVYI